MKQSPALKYVLHLWEHANCRGSNQRLNCAMWGGLKTAISSGMRFDVDDIAKIYNECRGSYWLKESYGFYELACGDRRATDNLSATLAFEKFYGRKPFLWAEDTKTPTRLYVGSKFTWKGEVVKVTSFNDKKSSLVACSYHEDQDGSWAELADATLKNVGKVIFALGDYRNVELLKTEPDGTTCLRLSPPVKNYSKDTRTIKSRFTITHDDLKAARKAFDDRRKAFVQNIEEARTLRELDEIANHAGELGNVRTGAYRHFDLEIIRDAFNKRREKIRDTQSSEDSRSYGAWRENQMLADLEKWTAGEDIKRHFEEIRVRIKGDRVEVSNGNSCTIPAAQHALKYVLNRRTGWNRHDEEVHIDAFKINGISSVKGVTVGCTVFPWEEVDRLAGLLEPVLNKS